MPSKRWTRVRVPQEVVAGAVLSACVSFSPRGVKEAYGIPNLMVRVRFPAWSFAHAERISIYVSILFFLFVFVFSPYSADDHVSEIVCFVFCASHFNDAARR